MSLRARIVALMGGLLLSFAAVHEARAADQQAMVDQISALTKSAFAAYSDGDLDKAKGQLLQAIAIGKKDAELAVHPLMARTYLLLGVVFIDGFEDHKKGVANFAKALKISPDIEIPEALATKTVKKAFDEAGGSSGGGGGGSAVASGETAEPAAADTASNARAEKEDKAKSARELREEKEQAAREAKEEKARAAREAKEERESAKDTERAVLTEKKRSEAEMREKERALAQAKTAESKERTEKERLQKEKEEKESQISEAKGVLTEAKGRLQQLEKDKAERDKQIAAGSDREKKEREAKEKLAAEKAEKDRLLVDKDKQAADKEKEKVRLLTEKDKQIADVKQQLQQAQKDKADKDKLIAAGNDREKKEREAKEKLEKDKQASEAREKERRAQEESARLDREKLAAGPDLPGHIAEAIYCALPDEVAAGTDLFVHCAAGPNVKAKEIAIYYRTGGVAHYNSLLMEHSKKGWYTTVIPAGKVMGKTLQYYVEARDSRDAVAGTNGKAQSPNILSLRAGGSLVANSAHAGGDGSLTPASSTSMGAKRAARSAGARQERVKAR